MVLGHAFLVNLPCLLLPLCRQFVVQQPFPLQLLFDGHQAGVALLPLPCDLFADLRLPLQPLSGELLASLLQGSRLGVSGREFGEGGGWYGGVRLEGATGRLCNRVLVGCGYDCCGWRHACHACHTGHVGVGVGRHPPTLGRRRWMKGSHHPRACKATGRVPVKCTAAEEHVCLTTHIAGRGIEAQGDF